MTLLYSGRKRAQRKKLRVDSDSDCLAQPRTPAVDGTDFNGTLELSSARPGNETDTPSCHELKTSFPLLHDGEEPLMPVEYHRVTPSPSLLTSSMSSSIAAKLGSEEPEGGQGMDNTSGSGVAGGMRGGSVLRPIETAPQNSGPSHEEVTDAILEPGTLAVDDHQIGFRKLGPNVQISGRSQLEMLTQAQSLSDDYDVALTTFKVLMGRFTVAEHAGNV